MAQAGHTAGQHPITIELGGEFCGSDRLIIANLGPNEDGIQQIRTVGRLFCYGGPEERDAYGRLIAAAPDLVEALKAAKALASDMGSQTPAQRCARIVEIVDAALSKAGGK